MSKLRPRATIAAFDAECLALTGIVQTLTPPDFARSTNCPPWTLHELIVHIADSVRIPDQPRPPARHNVPPGTAADYYRRAERKTVEYRTANVQRTRRSAARVSPDDLAALFNDAWTGTSRTVGENDPDERIEAAGRALTIDDYLLTRLMSVAAHGIDVAITLSRRPWTTQPALIALRPILVDLLGELPPPGWTDQDLLEIGTGRRPPTGTDRQALGSMAAKLPLLS
jgi:uncharacterized protein (TIGR03083 family)